MSNALEGHISEVHRTQTGDSTAHALHSDAQGSMDRFNSNFKDSSGSSSSASHLPSVEFFDSQSPKSGSSASQENTFEGSMSNGAPNHASEGSSAGKEGFGGLDQQVAPDGSDAAGASQMQEMMNGLSGGGDPGIQAGGEAGSDLPAGGGDAGIQAGGAQGSDLPMGGGDPGINATPGGGAFGGEAGLGGGTQAGSGASSGAEAQGGGGSGGGGFHGGEGGGGGSSDGRQSSIASQARTAAGIANSNAASHAARQMNSTPAL